MKALPFLIKKLWCFTFAFLVMRPNTISHRYWPAFKQLIGLSCGFIGTTPFTEYRNSLGCDLGLLFKIIDDCTPSNKNRKAGDHNSLNLLLWIKFDFYYTPIFRRDVLWYGGCPSVSPSFRLSVRLGLRPPVFRTFLLNALTYWAEIVHMTLF